MDVLLGVFVGVSLAAACGFRIFVPLFVMSIASASGHLELAAEFSWMNEPAAVVGFGVATLLEIVAYYIPAVDNALDMLAGPAAVVAGSIATAACLGEASPFLQWSLAVIGGGGAAATVQGLTTITRLGSTATTAGIGNPVVSTVEAGGSTALAVLAILLPVLAILFVVLLVLLTLRKAWGFFRRRRQRAEPSSPPPPATEDWT